jgi:hypothetical protein
MYVTLLVLIVNLKTLLAALFMLVLGLAYSLTLNVEVICSSETLADFKGLHSVISQKTKLFIITVVSSSNSSQFSVS